MKNLQSLLVLSILAVFCTACPYTSPFMAGTPMVADNVWNGQWVHHFTNDDSTTASSQMTFRVRKEDEMFLSTRLSLFPNVQPERRNMKAFLRKIGTTQLLLVYPLTQNTGKLFTYYKWHMPGSDSLELRALDEHKVPDTLQTLLMLENWLLHHAAADSFWEEPHLFIRPIVAITADVQR
jgi:hypothetical protein